MYQITDELFEHIRQRVFHETGICFDESRKGKLNIIISKRCREMKYDYAEYDKRLRTETEWRALVDRITINETSFFRNNPHFEALEATVIPELVERNAGTRSIRVWSAGCSTGEEPYSLAMTFLERMPHFGWRLEITATDISSRVIKAAESGEYPARRLGALSPERLARFFAPSGPDAYRIKPQVRDCVGFKIHNLKSAAYPGPFDLIFCRNVMIYFDKAQNRSVIERFHGCLTPGGYFFVGHSESLQRHGDLFRFVKNGKSVFYRKSEAADHAARPEPVGGIANGF